ncbi:MAG: BrnT family toxin [Synechocystis sp.]
MTEPRFLVIGKIDNKLWTMIMTYRGKTVRIISVRRSKNSEIKIYESN